MPALAVGSVAALAWFMVYLFGFGQNPNALYTFQGFWPDGQIAYPPYYNNCVIGQTDDHRCVIVDTVPNLSPEKCNARVLYSNNLPMLGASGNAVCQIQG